MGKLSINAFKMPNVPVKDFLVIKSLSTLPSNLYYSIMDLTGTVIIKDAIIECYEDIINIGIDFLKSGMYILRIQDDETYVMNSFQVN
jgi:hypothetical protein